MTKHNNVIPNVHLRKHWSKFVKTWFNQPARKRRRLQARQAKAKAMFPRPIEQLRPIVHGQTQRYKNKVRAGRGFTLQEIKECKLGVAFARSIGIAIDHRRKNKSQESLDLNKRRLQAYLQKLVLFPRKENQQKKGLVEDTAKDIIEKSTFDQNKEKTLMKEVGGQIKLREKAVKITKEMRDLKAYNKLRLERVNQYYKGIRDKKREEAAAAKK